MLKDVKLRDRVKSCLAGWGTVDSINYLTGLCYPVIVEFDSGKVDEFTWDGKSDINDIHPEITEVEKRKREPEEQTMRLIAIFEPNSTGMDAHLEEVYVESVEFNPNHKDVAIVCKSLVDEVELHLRTRDQVGGTVDIYDVSDVTCRYLLKIHSGDDKMISVGYITVYSLENVWEK